MSNMRQPTSRRPQTPTQGQAPHADPSSEPMKTGMASIKAHTRVTFFRSGGPGGQHRNKVETAVRLVHEPSGVTVVAADQRSRVRNLEAAFQRLQRKLIARSAVPRSRVPTRVPTAVRAARREVKQRRATLKALRRRVKQS